MKRVVLILIFVSLMMPVRFNDSEARELEYEVKDFIGVPALEFDDISGQPEGIRPQSKPAPAIQKRKISPPKESEATASTADPCQSGVITIGDSGEAAAGGMSCGILPSEQLMATWGDLDTGGTQPGMGALSFNVLWQHGAASLGRPLASIGPIDCAAGGVSTVRAIAYSDSGALLAAGGPWNCSGLSNSLYNIPAGTNVRLVVMGNNASGNVLYRGEKDGIIIAPGQTTVVGAVSAEPFLPALAGPDDGLTIAYGLIGFTWSGPSGAASYRIQVSKNKGFTTPFVDAIIPSPTFHMTAAMETQTYFWRVRAQDAFNNSGEWSTAWALTVDTASPFNTTAANFINNGVVSTSSATVSLTISAARNNGVAAYLISESPNRPLATAPTWVPVALTTSYASVVPYVLSSGDGMKAVYVWFRDAEGTVSKVVRDTILLDTAAPDTMMTATPANPSNGTTVSVQFAASEPGTTFQCSLDSGVYTACTSPHSYLGLAEGPHTIEVRAADAAGNNDLAPARYAWTVDTTPPDSMVTARPLNVTNATTADFAFSSSEPVSKFLCSIDGAEYAVCSSTQSYAGLGAGPHTIDVRAIDLAGNMEPIPVRVAWNIDLTPPETAITAQPAVTTNSTTDSFTFSSTEPGSSFQCQLDNGVSTPCSSPHSYAGLAPGPHTFTVRAADAVGNLDQTPAQYTWNIDTTPPDAVITAQPANPTNAVNAEFNFSSTEELSRFECSLDGGAYTSCNSPQTYLGLAEGIHTIDVKATDEAGNTDPIPAHYVWAVDLTPPDTAITISPADPTNATTTHFSFSASKPGATFECSLDNGAFIPCASPQTYEGLIDGSHSFAVKATDAVGNIDQSPAEYAWNIDTMPPETAITDQPLDPSSTGGARFSFKSSKPGSSFECQLDNGQSTACTSPFFYSDLRTGMHTFTVKAMDAVGNIDPSPESFTWIAVLPPKNTTPSSFINKGGAYYVHNNVVKLSLAAAESDGQGVRAYYISEDPTPPTPLDSGWVQFPQKKEFRQNVEYTLSEGNGKKTVYVWFKDANGNISEAKSDTIYYFNAERLITVFLILQLLAIL